MAIFTGSCWKSQFGGKGVDSLLMVLHQVLVILEHFTSNSGNHITEQTPEKLIEAGNQHLALPVW